MVTVWDSDPLAQMVFAVTMMDKVHVWIMLASQVYGKAEAEPAIYEDFKKMPTIYKTTRFVNQSDLSEELSVHNYHGFR